MHNDYSRKAHMSRVKLSRKRAFATITLVTALGLTACGGSTPLTPAMPMLPPKVNGP